MTNPFVRKLQGFIDLDDRDRAQLNDLVYAAEFRKVGGVLIRRGTRCDRAHILLDGWAYRYSTGQDRRAQITALFVPGDVIEASVDVDGNTVDWVVTLSDALIANVSVAQLRGVEKASDTLDLALRRAAAAELSIARQWLVNVGRRGAKARLAHLLCELIERLGYVGLADGRTCNLPVTQILLSDALGLTPIHVNRMLRLLHAEGIATLSAKRLIIHNPAALKQVAGFDPAYLHRRSHGGSSSQGTSA